MTEHWDLTKKKNIAKAAGRYAFESLPGISAVIAITKLADSARSFLMDTVATPDEQKQAAVEIIKKAKEADAESVEFTMDQSVEFGASFGFEDLKVSFGPKRSGKMNVKVKFK